MWEPLKGRESEDQEKEHLECIMHKEVSVSGVKRP